MYASAQTQLTPLRRLLPVVPILALAVILATGCVSPHSTANSRPMSVAVIAADGLSSHDGATTVAATPRELVALEAAGMVTLTRPRLSTTPRELIAMEAAGLVTLARPMPAPQLRPAWQGGAGYHIWGDCTDPIARQAAPELCW